MSYGSGADLEYRNLLAKAGILPAAAAKHDGPLLLQKAKTKEVDLHNAFNTGRLTESYLDGRYKNVGEAVSDAELPARLRAASEFITDANNATSNGKYYAFAAGSANFPFAGNWQMDVVTSDTLWVSQVAWEYSGDSSSDTKMYRRERNDNVWGSWYRLRQSEVELDARYKNVGEAIANSELPARLREDHDNDVPGNDWNNATATGFYGSSNAANSPGSIGTWFLGMTISHISGWCTQIVHEFTDDSNLNTKTWRRECNSGVWLPWYQIRQTEDELDARYGRQYTLPATLVGAPRWVRVATLNGFGSNDGAGVSLLISGHGDIVSTNRTTHLVHFNERMDAAHCEVWSFGSSDSVIPSPMFKYRRTAAYQFELWMQRNSYDGQLGVTVLSSKGTTNGFTTINLDSTTGTDPGGVSVTPLEIGNDSGWIAPTLLNSWVNWGAGNPNAGYRKIGNRVTFQGVIKNGTVTANAFVLPAGYMPPSTRRFTAVSNGTPSGVIDVSSTGAVNIAAGSNVWLDLSTVAFLVD